MAVNLQNRYLSAGDGFVRKILAAAGMDQAVVFTLLSKGMQSVSGVVTLLLIATRFSPEIQGYYYTFASMLALQSFVELGLYVVILSRASHEWSRLSIDGSGKVVGDPSAISRLASLMRFIAKWYAVVSTLFVLGAGFAGYLFLEQAPSSDISWRAPWWTVVSLAAVQLWLMPILSMLEGCNQVVVLNRFRLVQSIAEAITMWLLIIAGAGLWVAVGSLAVKVAAILLFLAVKYRRFFQSLLAHPKGDQITWRDEIWPMQWRIGASGIMNFFACSLFTPVMFHYYGAKVAGQMGMTLQVIGVIQALGLAWVQTKVPHFGMLASSREYSDLDKIWWRSSKLTLTFTLIGSMVFFALMLILNHYGVGLASRMLDPLPIALFLAAYVLLQITNCQAAYLRAYARESFLIVGTVGGLLIGGLVFVFGSKFGPTGAAIGYLAVICGFTVPLSTFIWSRRRAEWQAT